MAGSAFVKIDRLYESEMRARVRDAEKDKPIIHCGILDFFKQMTGFEPTAYQVALLLDPSQFVHLFHQMHWQSNSASLVGHAAGDGLADPPGGISGELETLGVVELLHCADQAEVAFLNQVE